MGTFSAIFERLVTQLPKLCALIVFAMAAGPGVCAIACDLDICPGCKVETKKKSCCKQKAKKAKCCEESSPMIELTRHKTSPSYVLWIPVVVVQPIRIEIEAFGTAQPSYVVCGRAPPDVSVKAKPSRAPPVA